MANVSINYDAVLNESGRCSDAMNKVNNAKNGMYSNGNNLDYRVKQRANVVNRMNSISANLNDINSRISSIQSVCNNGANKYKSADLRVKNTAANLSIGENIKFTSASSSSKKFL